MEIKKTRDKLKQFEALMEKENILDFPGSDETWRRARFNCYRLSCETQDFPRKGTKGEFVRHSAIKIEYSRGKTNCRLPNAQGFCGTTKEFVSYASLLFLGQADSFWT